MTTAAQALEALDSIDAFASNHWPHPLKALAATLRQHIESTAFELEALKHDVAHALMAATAEAEHADEVKAELEALRKDAERYRWLRERNRNGVSFRNVRGGRIAVYQYEGNPKRRSGEATVIRAEELDAAIDAALTQGGK